MRSYKPVHFLLIFISFTACSYGQVWRQYTDSAKFFQEQNKTEKAIEFYSKARESLKKDSANTKSYTTACNMLANIYYITRQYDKAEPLFTEVKQVREKVLGKKHPDYINSCNNLALLNSSMGRFEKVELLYIEVKQIREETSGKQHPDYAAACNNLAFLYRNIGQYEKAEPLALVAKEIREKTVGKEHPSYATSCINLAIIYTHMGRYEEAEPLSLEAKQLRQKTVGKDHLDYAQACNTLAALYFKMGQYNQAAPLFLEAKEIQAKQSGNRNPEYAQSCANLANLYYYMGRLKDAQLLMIESKEILEKLLGKESSEYAQSCNNLAAFYCNTGNYEKAKHLYLEANQIWAKVLGKEHPNYAISCHNLAFLYQEMSEYKKAELLYLEAKRIREKTLGKQHPEYGISCESLANLYWLMHLPLQAEKEFEESLAVNTYNISSVFQFTNEKEKAAFINNIVGEDDDAYSFFVSDKIKSGHPYTLSLFHRNLILSSSEVLKKQIFSFNDTTLINDYNEWISIKKQLSVLYAKPVGERKEDVTTIEEKAEQLEKQLTRLSSAFAKQQQRVDWRAIQNKLHANEASIEFASFQLTNGKRHTDTTIYAAFVLRKDNVLPTTVVLFAEKQLQDLLTSTGYKTTKAGVQKLYTSDGVIANNGKSSKKSIYDLVWKPLEKELKGITTIYFAPSGLLHRIAFSALPVNNKAVLSDRYKLIQLATTATIADQQRSYINDVDKIQLYGGISYNADTTALKDVAIVYHHDKAINRSLPDDITRSGQWNELPGTNKEIESIVALSGTYKTNITTHSGITATEEDVKSLDGKASPAVLHIATHGFFFPDPKQEKKDKISFESGTAFKLSNDPLIRSGLLFAGANNAWQNKPVEGIDDGILTAYEVSNLYLPNTKLVVLSACETGLGDIKRNEGVYGLQRAFKMAGVNSLVMSLWKVSDLETAEFMEAFYKGMFAQQTISDAFYNAQNIMKNKYRQQPFKWAAWVLVR